MYGLKTGRNDNGNLIHFYYNYSSEVMELAYPHPSGKELVSDKPVTKGESMSIEPWDVMIIEEGKER
jgi:beta-galactosidase